MEDGLEQKKIFHESTNLDFVKAINLEVDKRINDEFEMVDVSTKERLARYTVAAWVANCPLNFD